MKKNNKGFMLVEVIIVTVVVVSIMVSLYIAFNRVYNAYKLKNNYTNIDGIYAIKTVEDYLIDEMNLNTLLENSSNYQEISCSDSDDYCKSIFSRYNINRLFLAKTKKDDSTGKYQLLSFEESASVNQTFKEYIEYLNNAVIDTENESILFIVETYTIEKDEDNNGIDDVDYYNDNILNKYAYLEVNLDQIDVVVSPPLDPDDPEEPDSPDSPTLVSYCNGSGDDNARIGPITFDVRTDTPDFSQVATTDEGMYVDVDDLGNSCYFRGAVENNYVYFAGFYWRIIRINGDGTIRMIYDGTEAHVNGESSKNRIGVGLSAFSGSLTDDNSYFGYMYGTVGSGSYSVTHSNTYDSAIKQYLEQWYESNLNDYSEYISDAIYCNDREVSMASSNFTGNGTGIEETWYKTAERLFTNKSPLLTCSQKNDRFTVDSSNFSIETNGLMNKPIGLITGDEAAMAGGEISKKNTKYYLYAQDEEELKVFWTMSAWFFTWDDITPGASIFVISQDGVLNVANSNSDYAYARPVISLNSDALQYGDGTMTDPFRVEQ